MAAAPFSATSATSGPETEEPSLAPPPPAGPDTFGHLLLIIIIVFSCQELLLLEGYVSGGTLALGHVCLGSLVDLSVSLDIASVTQSQDCNLGS